jgi:hypothetical protein
MIDQKHLKTQLHYNPETGCFTWLVCKKGLRAGTVSNNITTAGGGKMYKRIRIDQKDYLAHRLAFLYMTGSFPKETVDHIDGDGLNNIWSNLRDVSISENNRNLRIRSDNSSGITGVTRRSDGKKWVAQIWVNGKFKYLGFFEEIEDAAAARYTAEKKYGFHKNHGLPNE